MRLIVAALIFTMPLQANAKALSSFDSLVGVWTGFERLNADTTYVATDAEVQESCNNKIHVYQPDLTYKYIERAIDEHEKFFGAIIIKPRAACQFKQSRATCPSELSIYGPEGIPLLSDDIVAQSTFSWNSSNQVDVSSIILEIDSEPFPDPDPDNQSLYRCPIALVDIDDWYASNPIPTGGQGIADLIVETISTSGTKAETENEKLSRAANNGDMDAARTRGVRYIIAYFSPALGESNAQKGIDLLKMAAESGDKFAHSALGHAYLLGPVLSGESFEWEKVIQHHTIAAQAEVADSLNSLAVMHVLGKTQAPDLALASQLFMDAADKGSVSAYFNLAALIALVGPEDLAKHGFTLNGDTLTAMAHAKYAMDKGIPAAQGLWQYLARTHPELENQAISKAISLTRAMAKLKPTADPRLQMRFTFKATNTGIQFNDADINYNYEFSLN